MKAYFLHISINIVGDVDEDALKEKFDLGLDWLQYIPGCWIVRTTSDTAKWLRRLSPILNNKCSMLIARIELPTQAFRLPVFAMDWIEKYLPERTS